MTQNSLIDRLPRLDTQEDYDAIFLIQLCKSVISCRTYTREKAEEIAFTTLFFIKHNIDNQDKIDELSKIYIRLIYKCREVYPESLFFKRQYKKCNDIYMSSQNYMSPKQAHLN